MEVDSVVVELGGRGMLGGGIVPWYVGAWSKESAEVERCGDG